MNTGPWSAARFASLAPWLNSRLDMVVMLMARLACPNGVETLLQLWGQGQEFSLHAGIPVQAPALRGRVVQVQHGDGVAGGGRQRVDGAGAQRAEHGRDLARFGGDRDHVR